MRSLGAAAVCASAVAAGIIASSSGRASVAPAPRSTVRRDRCFFVRNMVNPSVGLSSWAVSLHAEGIARDDAGHDGREPVVLIRGPANHGTHLRHIVIPELPPEGIHHELFGQ